MSFLSAIPYSLRALLRAPGFTIIATVVLALGIGTATTIFTMADEFLLNPFPYPEVNQLVVLWESNPALGGITANRVPVAWNNLEAWRSRNRSFQAIEAFQMFLGYNLTGLKLPEHLTAARATAGFFNMFGVNAALGRTFAPGDDIPGMNPIIIISYDFAKKHFADDNPLGRTLLLNNAPYSIIGVLPREFHLPALFEGISEYKPDVWLPLPKPSATDSALARRRYLRVCARLKSGVSLALAADDLRSISAQRAQEDPDLDQGYSLSVFPLSVESIDPDLRKDIRVLSLAAVVVLLLACANLAGMMLLRVSERRRNIAIMAALGGRRWALIAPILSESAILALVGGAFGLLVCYAGVHFIAALKPIDLHSAERLSMNVNAFIFAVCVSLSTVLVFGFVPAWIATRANLNVALKSTLNRRAGGRFTRNILVAFQVAVALSLGITAALLNRSFQHLLRVNPGFSADQVLTAQLSLPPQRYPNREDRSIFCRRLQQNLQSLPGVQDVALVDSMPLYAIRYSRFQIEGRPAPQRNSAPSADIARVTPNFFSVMGIPRLEGRSFTDQDAEADPPQVVILNETLARQFWPKGDAVGSHIRELPINGPPGPWQTVIGIVGDFLQFNVETPARPEMLWPARAFTDTTIALRTASSDPSALAPALEQTVWNLDREEPLSEVQPLQEKIAEDNSQRRFNMLAVTGFAGFSILLTLVGLYGLVSSFISSHVRDIGIRFALGARRAQVCLSLLRSAMPPVLAGIVFGVSFALLAQRLIAAILFQTSALDPVVYVATAAGLLATLILASLVATLRAARIDPASVLRDE